MIMNIVIILDNRKPPNHEDVNPKTPKPQNPENPKKMPRTPNPFCNQVSAAQTPKPLNP